ncbi:bifunctional folylpolyglutamate synthase/dihydrofolate synthase [Candidatus Xianfuyuplasma coldseepsis]|uniref:tetrahydrofolate synthase n=1 Tax=Candidatus Xianfuyuplasma coldseepsis TaxID=2782163 RepID=A0A7L7KTN9_9MOLU|nr:folylpolyglutamate synthase/dihydrofolate synthase family protein [Xianfuyuplasma coldseepsis]QMS85789.1 bifunctional folylpolyglutamate synthase/dihydrofolate synthase [Xianfuyuplasma coldseepsis]
MFKTLQPAIEWIESVKRFGDKLDLSRMNIACEKLGHPERTLRVIHVAGTNGKGSTVTFLKHALLEQGYHVGTFISPYIIRFNERITVDYNDIDDEELLVYINQVYSLYHEVLHEYNQVITFFELITLISFLYFRDQQLDFCIYEVGLGGRLDATNVVQPIMTVITSISYDHMGVLGNTLESIAFNKLGIVKDKIPLVTAVTNEELIPVFESVTTSHDSDLIILSPDDITNITYGPTTSFTYKDEEYHIDLLGTHQVTNACLAIEVLTQMQQRDLVRITNNSIKQGLKAAYWPGRMERFGNIILDGAHNIGGIEALKDTMETYFKNFYVKVLYTSMTDKEYFDNIQVLEQFADEIYFTEFDYPRCEDAQTLYDVSNHPKKFLVPNAIAALQVLRQLEANELLLITGSLYFISYIRKEL